MGRDINMPMTIRAGIFPQDYLPDRLRNQRFYIIQQTGGMSPW